MKKRIRLHQVRVGMFIEELECSANQKGTVAGRFLISSPSDIDRMMQSHALSVIIDTRRGLDVDARHSAPVPNDPVGFNTFLTSKFSAAELGSARKAIEQTRPHVHALLMQVKQSRTFSFELAGKTVDTVMAEAGMNAGAIIAVSKLKDKDEGTFLHSLAVSALMIAFGRNLGLSENAVQLLGMGGLVHDLGKMTLPTELLRKPGKLTPHELAIMRTHPIRGHEMVEQIQGIEQAVLDVCLYHHEKFDGSGYPVALQGENIPYVARIAAICDVYDALTTVRPYKPAWTQGEAIDTMLSSRGHFDPELLKSFISLMIISGTVH